jgi:hypothetical protein
MSTTAGLPRLYESWANELLGAPIPAETAATCESCAMVPETEDDGPGFRPTLKCCTYMPRLWNFLVGAILLDQDPEAAAGRATIEARVRNGVVTPLGLMKDAAYDALYNVDRSFGNDPRLLCPHYLDEHGGICSIWRYRESTCTTYYCKVVRGAVGAAFWAQLKQLLLLAEQSLSAWCVAQLGLTRDEATAWGEWRGRELEFFRECARLVDGMAWPDVVAVGGAELVAQADLTRAAFARLVSSADPERPKVALVQIEPRGPGRVRLSTYSDSDALDAPTELANLLPYFDGRPMREALSEIQRREHITMNPLLVRKLIDFGVLTDTTADRESQSS